MTPELKKRGKFVERTKGYIQSSISKLEKTSRALKHKMPNAERNELKAKVDRSAHKTRQIIELMTAAQKAFWAYEHDETPENLAAFEKAELEWMQYESRYFPKPQVVSKKIPLLKKSIVDMGQHWTTISRKGNHDTP